MSKGKKLSKRKQMVLSGNTFEIFVAEYLETKVSCDIKSNYLFYSPRIGRGTECDVLLITDTKIYCIECKNYNRLIDGKWYEPEWYFVSSGKRNYVSNPVLANDRHIRTIKGLLNAEGISDIEIENIVCVPDNCEIRSKCQEVYTLSRLAQKIVMDSYLHKKINRKQISETIDKIRYDIRRS